MGYRDIKDIMDSHMSQKDLLGMGLFDLPSFVAQ